MKYDDLNLKKIREVPIFDVCSKLGITLYGTGKQTKRTKCWYHEDKHPSMHVNKVRNIYKCFVCGKGGDVIKLVMDNDNKSFIEAFYFMLTGENFHDEYKGEYNHLIYNVKIGHLPLIEDLEIILKALSAESELNTM